MEPVRRGAKILVFISLHLLTGQFGSGHLSDDGFGHADFVNGKTFDFIVVGGGVGGCTISARLAAAENGKYSVLLIEAGGLPSSDLDIPALSVQFDDFAKIYPSVRHSNAALAQNGVVSVIRPFTLGGGSAINGQILNRGSPHDYNNWARLTGDDSWNYSNMLKYFKKFENYSGDFPSDQRGFNGPITVSRQRYAPGLDTWLQAGKELGFQVADPNGPQIVSFTHLDFTRKQGRRVTSYKGYIEPMLHAQKKNTFHSNLLILINSEVKRIIFDGNRAVGVNFTSSNATSVVGYAMARKAIILSCGAIESPVLLMKSGVGPKSVLEASHIPPVKYLPVGRNLHDHPHVSLVVAFRNRSTAFDEDIELTPAAWRQFIEFGDGPYTSYMGMGQQAMLVSSALSPEERQMGWADLQLYPLMGNVRSVVWNRDGLKDIRECEIAVPWPVFLARPKSRGTITLNPKNVEGIPLIDFQYLTNPQDIRVLVEGLKMSANLCENTISFQEVGCRVPKEVIPACAHLEYRSDSYWECHARQLMVFGFHAVGTCKMGSGPTDPDAVVDSQLRVIGIEGLYIADASAIPSILNCNTQAAVYAIAEKAADMILRKWEGQIEVEVSHSGNPIDGDGSDWQKSIHIDL